MKIRNPKYEIQNHWRSLALARRNTLLVICLILSVLCLLSSVFCLPANADDSKLSSHNDYLAYPADAKMGALYMVDITADDDNEPNVLTRSWADIKDNITRTAGTVTGTGRWLETPPQWTICSISMFAHAINEANDAATGAFDVNAYAARKYGGAKQVFSGPCGIGNTQLSHNPESGTAFRTGETADPNYKWADSFTMTDNWPLGVYKAGHGGTNDILVAEFPTDGFDYVGVFVDNANWTVIDHVYIVISGSSI